MKTLKLARDLSLPLDAVTQTIAILAKRRAGKSYTMRRLIEQLLHAGQQVVIVDPKGDQWGIRSAADGKAPGLPIVILGGERGDVPLESTSGEVVAKLVVEERVSVLLDLSLFRKHEVATFMTAFLENLYRLKAKEIYRTPVMLVIDEADAVAPQKPQKGEERMLGAAEDIVRRGGQRGIGCVLVTQRSAVLNKNVLTQAQMLVVLRTIAPQDLAAMKAWIDVHGDVEQGRILMESLPSLPVGDAWFWSPGWPTTEGIFKRVHVLPIETFDSGASPKPGVKPVEPKNLADVDLDALKGQMAATIEKAKADDPRELRKALAAKDQRIKELEKAASGFATSNEGKKTEVKRVGVLTDADRAALSNLAGLLAEVRQAIDDQGQERINRVAAKAREEIGLAIAAGKGQMTAHAEAVAIRLERPGFQRILEKLSALSHEPAALTLRNPATPTYPKERRPERAAQPAGTPGGSRVGARPAGEAGDASIGKSGLRRMLIALAQRPKGLTRGQLGVRAQVSSKGGSFDTYLSKARVNGWIDSTGDRIAITDAGLTALGEYVPLPEGRDLLDHYLREFGASGAARMLTALAEAYPKSLTRAELAEQSNVSAAGGSFDTYLSKLRTLELIDGRGELRASEELFS